MSSPFLRSGVPADAGDIWALHRRSILQIGLSEYTKEECESWAYGLTPKGYVNAMTTGGETYSVVEVDGVICGFCSFKANEVMGCSLTRGKVEKVWALCCFVKQRQ